MKQLLEVAVRKLLHAPICQKYGIDDIERSTIYMHICDPSASHVRNVGLCCQKRLLRQPFWHRCVNDMFDPYSRHVQTSAVYI